VGDVGERYPQLLRGDRERWWRPVLGLLFFGVCLVSASAAVIVVALLGRAATSGSVEMDNASLPIDSPIGLLANNLVLAALIPAAALTVLVVHRRPVGVLASVRGNVRWGWLLRLLGVALGVMVLSLLATLLLPGEGSDDISVPPAGQLAGLVAVILLTTPLQSAGEEVGFRGYLTQAVACWFRRPLAGAVVAAGVTAVLFALAHGVQDPALFLDRLAFGLTASWLVWRTGGLEASVALHVVNNLVALLFSASTGQLEDSITGSTLPWSLAALDVATMVVFALLAGRLADRWGVAAVRADQPVTLAGPGGVGYPGSRPPAPPPAGSENPWGMG
jgi:uncharacterized protein